MTSIFNTNYFFIFIIAFMMLVMPVVKAEEVEATLIWSKRVELSTPVNGIVQKVFAQTGKTAAKGEVLVQLSPPVFKANLKYAKANYKNTKEQHLEAKRELDRQSNMYEDGMLSEHDLQTAKNNFTAALAKFQLSQSSLTKAKLNLGHSAIRAPFNAIIISVIAVKGQVVVSTVTPPVLVIVAEAQRMVARFYAKIDKVNELVVNQGMNVNISGRMYQGKILTIALEADKVNLDHYAVDVIFDSKDTVLRAGQKVSIKL
jgi:multidrug efflux system membrane fusion protein